MKCQNCGADLKQGVFFCRECGSKTVAKMFCRGCGNEISPKAKYCSLCGTETVSGSAIKIEHWDMTMNLPKKFKYNKEIDLLNINDSENDFDWVDVEHTTFTFKLNDENNREVKEQSVIPKINNSDAHKGTNYDDKIACYSYLNDDWHNYRAIPLTDKLVKIECWHRESLSEKFLFGYEICVLNINYNDNDFEWNADKSSFTITIKDYFNASYWKKPTSVSFTLENPDYKYCSVLEYLEFITSSIEKPQKDGFAQSSTVMVGDFSFSIPSYWRVRITEKDHYRAYAETSGKVAMLDIRSSYDENDPVTYNILVDETENGLMSNAFKSWYESCGDITIEKFNNGAVKGFIYSTYFIFQKLQGYSRTLCFPNIKNNNWFYFSLFESNNTKYSYTDDFAKILNSITKNTKTSKVEIG